MVLFEDVGSIVVIDAKFWLDAFISGVVFVKKVGLVGGVSGYYSCWLCI